MVKNLPDYVGKGPFENNLSENQKYPLEKKYLLRDKKGDIAEKPEEAIYRMAKTMAEVELNYGKSQEEVEIFTEEFYDFISNGLFSPAGRIWTNAGTEIGGLFNCYALPIEDDIEGIYESVKKAALIHKNGGGTGYNFSKLRSRGTYVQNSKGIASGPVSFIEQFDVETKIINSGNRRGANMGILNVDHPDILDFIYAKYYRKEIPNFNISVGINDEFIKAVENDEFYTLKVGNQKPFTYNQLEVIIKNVEENKLGGSGVGEVPRPASLQFEENKGIILGETKVIDQQTGKVAGRVGKEGYIELSANYIIDTISQLAWGTGDPGLISLDEINRHNPLPGLGPLDATNPCGEQPLHPWDACNLGSIIINNILKENKDNEYEIDKNELKRAVYTAVRFMDNVNDANRGPIPEVQEMTLANRRIGLGVMGWADALAKMNIPYDSNEARDFARDTMGYITDTAKEASVKLAKEKDVFPNFDKSVYKDGKLENRVRNSARTTLAPTGTISMLYDVSSGIEPFYAISYKKNIRGGDSLLYTVAPFVEECEKRGIDLDKIAPLIKDNNGSVQGLKEIPEDMQKVFKTALDLDYKDHILMQAAFQEKTDNAVSKTINMHEDATVEDVKNAYMFALKNKVKGITVYRNNSRDIQVLETSEVNKLEKRAYINSEDLKIVPDIMPTLKITQNTPVGKLHSFITVDPKADYRPVEFFSSISNSGAREVADLEAICRGSSIWLRANGNYKVLEDQFKKIGSSEGVISRDGQVLSMPMGVSRTWSKFGYLQDNGLIPKYFLGEIDPEELEAEVADVLRKNSGDSSNEDSNEKDDGKPKKKPDNREKCPDCGSPLKHEAGCKDCVSCGFSKCQ